MNFIQTAICFVFFGVLVAIFVAAPTITSIIYIAEPMPTGELAHYGDVHYGYMPHYVRIVLHPPTPDLQVAITDPYGESKEYTTDSESSITAILNSPLMYTISIPSDQKSIKLYPTESEYHWIYRSDTP